MGMTAGNQRVGKWFVFTRPDGQFGHARHDDMSVLIAWTFDDFVVADPDAAAEYDLLNEPVDAP